MSTPTSAVQAAPRAALRFDGLWLFTRRSDLLIVALPFLLAASGFAVTAALGISVGDAPNPFAIWTAQNVLGNGTHVVLTFLLLGVRKDVLRAAPNQGRAIS